MTCEGSISNSLINQVLSQLKESGKQYHEQQSCSSEIEEFRARMPQQNCIYSALLQHVTINDLELLLQHNLVPKLNGKQSAHLVGKHNLNSRYVQLFAEHGIISRLPSFGTAFFAFIDECLTDLELLHRYEILPCLSETEAITALTGMQHGSGLTKALRSALKYKLLPPLNWSVEEAVNRQMMVKDVMLLFEHGIIKRVGNLERVLHAWLFRLPNLKSLWSIADSFEVCLNLKRIKQACYNSESNSFSSLKSNPAAAVVEYRLAFGIQPEKICRMLADPALSAILRGKVPEPREISCYQRDSTLFEVQRISSSISYSGYSVMSSSELLSIQEAWRFTFTEVYLVPRRIIFVWFLDPATTLSSLELEALFHKHNPYIFRNADTLAAWNRRMLWVNDLDKLPPLVQEACQQHNITLHKFHSKLFKSSKRRYLAELAVEFTKYRAFAYSTDIVRDLLVNLLGGVYVDGDYLINERNLYLLEAFMQSYCSFFGFAMMFPQWMSKPLIDAGITEPQPQLGNAFLASEKEGKVLTTKIDFSYTTLLDVANAPLYSLYPCRTIVGVVVQTGPGALTVAFVKALSTYPNLSNETVILDHGILFNHTSAGLLGGHDSAQTWKEGLYEPGKPYTVYENGCGLCEELIRYDLHGVEYLIGLTSVNKSLLPWLV